MNILLKQEMLKYIDIYTKTPVSLIMLMNPEYTQLHEGYILEC